MNFGIMNNKKQDMANKIKTYHDGWDCVPQLKRAMRTLTHFGHLQNEINNCVRQHQLEDIVNEIKEKLEETIELLDEIDTTQEFETVDIEEFDEL